MDTPADLCACARPPSPLFSSSSKCLNHSTAFRTLAPQQKRRILWLRYLGHYSTWTAAAALSLRAPPSYKVRFYVVTEILISHSGRTKTNIHQSKVEVKAGFPEFPKRDEVEMSPDTAYVTYACTRWRLTMTHCISLLPRYPQASIPCSFMYVNMACFFRRKG